MNLQARILAVDDDPQNLVVFEELLGEEYDLKTLSRGSEVLQVAREFRPDLILLDIMMPETNGYEVCRRIRADRELRNIKVMLVSAKAMVPERLEGYACGADDYITKPFVMDEFMAKVRVCLRLKSIEELNELRNQFLTLLNHETRTPLSTIIASAELMADQGSVGDGTRRELSGIILQGARRILGLLEKVTLLSQLQGRDVSFRCVPIDAVAVLRAVVVVKEAPCRDQGITIAICGAESALVVGNAECLKMVFETLLDNAIRFSPAASEVQVEVTEGSQGVAVSVADRGPGIDPGLLPQLWDGFLVGDLKHHAAGHGVSLALARGMLHATGGSIVAAARPGGGTRFTVSLPTPLKVAA